MVSPILVPCLVRLRSDFTIIAPDRDRTSDGWIGDEAHQNNVSDHNDDEVGNVPIRDADNIHEVHAIDVDVDLRLPGLSMQAVVDHLVARHRAGLDDRLRYIIFNRRIYSASDGWLIRGSAYTGANPHDKHAHFSAQYGTAAEADTRSWKLEDIPMPLTPDDIKLVRAGIKAELDSFGDRDPLATILGRTGEQRNRMTALVASVAELDDDEWTPAEIETLAGKLAEKLPVGQAKQLADELAARLAS